MLHHPARPPRWWRIALAGISAGGEGPGVALDATGVGAVAGVPLNVVSAAGIAAGVGIAAPAATSLADERRRGGRGRPRHAE